MDSPTHQQHQPTLPGNCLPCPQHRQYLCRSGSGSPRRSPWEGPSAPSSHPLQCACARPESFSRDSAREGVVDQVARWRDSAESSCVGNQSRGSSGCREGREARRPRASELVHHPTSHCQLFDPWKSLFLSERYIPVPSRIHRFGPSFQRTLRIPCCGRSSAAQSQSWTRSDTCCSFRPP